MRPTCLADPLPPTAPLLRLQLRLVARGVPAGEGVAMDTKRCVSEPAVTLRSRVALGVETHGDAVSVVALEVVVVVLILPRGEQGSDGAPSTGSR